MAALALCSGCKLGILTATMVLRATKEMGPTAEQSTDLRDDFDGRPMCIAAVVAEL